MCLEESNTVLYHRKTLEFIKILIIQLAKSGNCENKRIFCNVDNKLSIFQYVQVGVDAVVEMNHHMIGILADNSDWSCVFNQFSILSSYYGFIELPFEHAQGLKTLRLSVGFVVYYNFWIHIINILIMVIYSIN